MTGMRMSLTIAANGGSLLRMASAALPDLANRSSKTCPITRRMPFSSDGSSSTKKDSRRLHLRPS